MNLTIEKNEEKIKKSDSKVVDSLIHAIGYSKTIDHIINILQSCIESSGYAEKEKKFIFDYLDTIFKVCLDEKLSQFDKLDAYERVSKTILQIMRYSDELLHLVTTYKNKFGSFPSLFNDYVNMDSICVEKLLKKFFADEVKKNTVHCLSDLKQYDQETAKYYIELYDLLHSQEVCDHLYLFMDIDYKESNGEKGESLLDKLKKWLEENTVNSIYNYFDSYVISQEEAKLTVASFAYTHVQRVCFFLENPDARPIRNHIFLIGPSGSGKSFLMELLPGILPKEIPVIIISSSRLTSEAYSGLSLSTILSEKKKTLREYFDYSIIVMDEADKVLASPGPDDDAAVVDNVMSLLDGNSNEIVASERTNTASFECFNSKSISFAFTGAVASLTYLKSHQKHCGFIESNERNDCFISQNELRDKLIALGYKPEFIGRISCFVMLNKLSIEDRIKEFKGELYPALAEMLKAAGTRISLATDCKTVLANELYQDVGFREMQSIAMQIYYSCLREMHPSSSCKYTVTSEKLRNILGYKARW